MAESVAPSKGYDGYGYLWWLTDNGSYRAGGIYGQRIYIDPAKRVVIAAHSSTPTAVQSEFHEHLEAIAAAFAKVL